MSDWRRGRDTSEGSRGGARNPRVDLGLELLALRAKRGGALTRHDIAAWAGCTDTNIYNIERRALVKLANRIGIGRNGREFRRLLA